MVSNIKQKQEKMEEAITVINTKIATLDAEATSSKSERMKLKSDMEKICKGDLPDGIVKLLDIKVSQYTKALLADITLCKSDLLNMRSDMNSLDTKLETAIEAKLVESIAKSSSIIQKELEPSWASIVKREIGSKFEKMDKVSDDIAEVERSLAEVKSNTEDLKDKEMRAQNVIIYRLEEQGTKEDLLKSDNAFCLQLFNEILGVDVKEEDIKSLYRLGKKSNQASASTNQVSSRPLLIQLRERSVKNLIMESLFKLKMAEDKFKKISVAHDLTKLEREECKQLIARKKQDEKAGEFLWRVRGPPGQLKIVKIWKH